ncbi:MAG: phosphopyruvate hydratase [Acidimicrobiia bacterium]
MPIEQVTARMVLDSRGRPTVEAEVEITNGATFIASAPSGASTGSHEAMELRDGDPTRWAGQSVERALTGIRSVIGPALIGMDPTEQRRLDLQLVELDGTPDRSRLGANAILAVSAACARAGAAALEIPLWEHLADASACTPSLPLPMINVLSGNLHAAGGMDIQDVLVVPHGAPSYEVALEWAAGVYRRAGALLRAKGEPTLVGDEGGYGLVGGNSKQGIDLVVEAIVGEGLVPGVDMSIALDVAGAHLLADDGRYRLDGDVLEGSEFIERLVGWCHQSPICSIEDPLGEDAWDLWSEFVSSTRRFELQVLGDDLIVTHLDRLQRAIDTGAANAVLVKANQVGTISEALEVAGRAAAHGFRAVVSARSGETEDDWLADLAIASGAGQIKVGSLVRSERLAKYNRLLRVGERASDLRYAGGGPTLPLPELAHCG